jgi:type VI secretion system protein ImpL
VLAAVVLLLLAVVILLVVLARKRRVVDPIEAEAQPAAAPAAAPAEPPAGEVVTVDFTRPDQGLRLAGSFRRALRDLRRHLRTSDYRYRLPWVLLVGETASGKSGLLGRCGLDLPLGPPADPVPEEGAGCSWWFLERGVVLDTAGDFVLGADGKSSSRRGWNLLLRSLRTARPQRPLDGFVLAVPCAGLLSAEAAAISQKAVLLCQKLRDAQRQLGMVIPLSVVVTGCERLPGFTSFFREVPERAWSEIFGWSSPYAPDTPFRPEWVDEGFDTVQAGVRRAQLRILGERLEINEPDGVFAFPHELLALREPLRTFLAALCRPSTFSETLSLRGFYLSGELGGETVRAEAPPAPAPSAGALSWDRAADSVGGAGTVLFLRDLFDTKIFAERGLAHPAAGSLASRGRLVLAAQIGLLAFIALAGLGTWWAHDRLADRGVGLKAFLATVPDRVRQAHRERAGEGVTADGCPDIAHAADDPILTDQAYELVRTLSTFDADHYYSLFLPSSWFSPFNREVRQVIGIAYDHLVFEALESGVRFRLHETLHPVSLPVQVAETAAASAGAPMTVDSPLGEEQLSEESAGIADLGEEQVLDEDPMAVSGSAPSEPRVDDLPELKALRAFVDQVRELESRVHVYNGLKKTEDLKGLSDLLFYLFKRQTPEGFLVDDKVYRRSLQEVSYRPIQLTCRAPEAQATADLLAEALFRRLGAENALVDELHGLDKELLRVSSSASFQPGDLDGLALQISHVEQALALPELAWIHNDSFQMWPAVQTVLTKARGSELLGATAEQAIAERGKSAWSALQTTLQRPASSGDPMLEKEGVGKPWRLSPNLATLRTALVDLRNESFMQQDAAVPFKASIPRGTRLFWDARQLQAAAALYKPYEQFVQTGLRRFPASLRRSLQAVARKRAVEQVIDQVARAQTFRADIRSGDILLERNVQAQVESLQAAGPALTEVINVLDSLGEPTARDVLQKLTVEQAYGVLRGVDRLLASEHPYLPRGGDFSWWDGDRTVVFPAYDVENAEELAAYLTAQRSRLSQLADQYADPALRLLGDAERHQDAALRTLILKWQAILSSLHGYEAKRPGNSLASLETWIAQGMADIQGGNCLRVLKPTRLDVGLSDFFFQTRNALRGDLYKRCRDLTQDRVLIAYQDIERAFNQHLAGRFPFSAGLPGALDNQADPDDLRAFFSVFDKRAPIFQDLPDNDRRFGDDQREVLAFIDRLTGVRKLFAAFLDDPLQPALPTFGLDVDFRVNIRAEKGGNQIIGWRLQSGRQSFVRGGAESRGSWTAKDPVVLTLQWAKDGQVGPLPPAPATQAAPSQPHMKVTGPTVTYEYNGMWSLLALLREYAGRPADFAGGDPRPQTLRFAVDTGPPPPPVAEDGKDAKKLPPPRERTGQTIVYVRVTLTTLEKDKRQDIEMPAFPSRAPSLSGVPDDNPAETARGAS